MEPIALVPGRASSRRARIGIAKPRQQLLEVVCPMRMHRDRCRHHLAQLVFLALDAIAFSVKRQRYSQSRFASRAVVTERIVEIEQYSPWERIEGPLHHPPQRSGSTLVPEISKSFLIRVATIPS